jgi:DNA-directed RNA polymerase subunit RPC12/RpoP
MATLRIEVVTSTDGSGDSYSRYEEEIDEEERYFCASCEVGYEEDQTETVYECGSCGTTFTRADSADGDSNRCPDCNKFGAKSGERACSECGETVELTTCAECSRCDAWVGLSELAGHFADCRG